MSNGALNKRQMDAVVHSNGPMMVLAGPGSGKTTVITHRVRHLIEQYNVSAKDILVITFTRAAANEMKQRFCDMTSNVFGNTVSFGTFHSFFYRILRYHYRYTNENLLSENQRKDVIMGIINELGLGFDEKDDFYAAINHEITLIKSDMLDIKYYNSMNCGADDFRNIVNKYESFKDDHNKIDFDDMLTKCYDLISNDSRVLEWWRNKYKYILIDEFQDINKVQYECIKLLAAPTNNLFVVGDDDQSIYKFRGARPEFLLSFPKDLSDVKTVILNVNYRSTDIIINVCRRIIKENRKRYQKDIIGTMRKGKPIKLIKPEDVTSEAVTIAKKIKQFDGKIPFNEIAIIYRTNIQARAFIEALMDLKIRFQVRDEVPSIYEHFICKDLCAYLSLSTDINDGESLMRIINKPTRYINKSIISEAAKKGGNYLGNMRNSKIIKLWQINRLDELTFYLKAIKQRTPYDAIKYIRKAVGYDGYLAEYASYRKITPSGLVEILNELMEGAKEHKTIADYLCHVSAVRAEMAKEDCSDGVVLSTIHSAKGLEFEIVFVPSIVEGIIPHERSRTDDEIEEERRLLYVAMTRAKRFIYMSVVKTRYEQEMKPSRFLKAITTGKADYS